MANIIGRFYFKRTATGNLLGEYSNNKMDRVETECANVTPGGNSGDFVGTYTSMWHDGSLHQATLTIVPKPNSNNSLYTLTWTGQGTTYWGEGMLVDNILIGDYRNFKDINQ